MLDFVSPNPHHRCGEQGYRTKTWLARHTTASERRPVILLGATAAVSLNFLRGFPEYLTGRGWNVHIVSSEGPELAEYEHGAAATSHVITMERDPHPVSDIRSLLKWIRLMREVRPDIVMVGTPKAATLAMFASAVARVPTRIYHILGLRLETTAGIARAILLAMERITCACATRVLAVSPSLVTSITHYRIARNAKLDLIEPGTSNGIDLELFSPTAIDKWQVERLRDKLGISSLDHVIGYVGRIHPDKGISDLVRAIQIIHESNPEASLKLLVIGTRDREGFDPFLDSQIDVLMVEYVPDPRPYYKLMDVLCLPTLREGFPNVPLEASAMGVPVVTTDATGARDSVQHEVTGLLVARGDYLNLANALRALLMDPDYARRLGLAGLEWVKQFDRNTIWKRQASYLQDQLTGRERHRERGVWR